MTEIKATNEVEQKLIKEIKDSENKIKEYLNSVDKEKYVIMLSKMLDNMVKLKVTKVGTNEKLNSENTERITE